MNSDSIFISYARLDQDFVLQLAQVLKDRGLLVWVDQWSIPPGADWDRAIDNAIRDCTRFVIVLSPAATASDYAGEVRGELRRAMGLHKEILPVLYHPCEIPRQLLHIEYIDFSTGLKKANVDLLAGKLCGETNEVPPSDRMKFINSLQNVPEDARAFKHDLSKTTALEISKRLADSQFDALRDLKAARDRRDHGAIGIVSLFDVLSGIWSSACVSLRGAADMRKRGGRQRDSAPGPGDTIALAIGGSTLGCGQAAT